ncbi:MAG TPA: DUF1579 domain-containing protein [Aliidongia sp.]|uniref:DUF1579 domain-containing protein n=1 Tax=Aliidongia sp. TaxID=1914230 RepID=UPI002DDD6A2A|nr:DUF1579 domain-containing protein [Aliidongia sp.]HEV2678538.1 DUF1579 domain-containing protein [Aliidongia sp.]
MVLFRKALFVGCLVAMATARTFSPGGAWAESINSASAADGRHDFDFLIGRWRVHHRVLKRGSDREWVEFEGTSATRPVMGGLGNVEDNVLAYPAGTYRAAALRSFDAKSGQWSIWWLDGRSPLGPLDPPVRGNFHDGVGTFYSDDVVDGKPSRTRYVWSKITKASCQWEQATSADGGATWTTNWVMNFKRVPR